MSDQAAFLTAIRSEAWRAMPWLTYADWCDDHATPEEAERARNVGMLLQYGTGDITEGLATVRRHLGGALNDAEYLNYLETAAKITRSEHTQLQADYLRDYLEEGGQGEAILARLTAATRAIPMFRDAGIRGYDGRLTLNVTNVQNYNIEGTPPHFHCSGHLHLMNSSTTRTLGEGLHVGKNLTVENYTGLESIGRGLNVEGDARFENNETPVLIGAGVRIGGDFRVHDYTWLVSIGEGCDVGGDVQIIDCFALQSVGMGFRAGGKTLFSNCPALMTSDEDIQAGGSIMRRGNTPSGLMTPQTVQQAQPHLSHD